MSGATADGRALDSLRRARYGDAIATAPQVTHEALDAAVDQALAALLPAGDQSHLARAAIAERLAAVAAHHATNEVAAARDQDGASWDDVAHAFGLSPRDAQARFRTRPPGLPE
jgi:acyl-CoA reductase-like NAD-dependent aldehyde dehydrogenase